MITPSSPAPGAPAGASPTLGILGLGYGGLR
jgi:hypothetical protein